MIRCFRHGWLFLILAASLALTASALALITAPLPLDAIVEVSDFIVVAKVEKVDPAQPQVVLSVQEDLKAKSPFRRFAVHFSGDAEAKKLDHVPQLLKRLGPDLPVMLLITKRDKAYTSFVFTNGTWFQIAGQQTGDTTEVAWRLTHGEPFLRRTFKGTTAEMRQLVVDELAGKGALPAYNKKELPGFGPEVGAKDKEKSSQLHRRPFFGLPTSGAGGPLFGVIPTLGVGAPLLVLAALFPAVFGGVLLLFRQWIAFITVFSINSTLMLLQWLLNAYWPGVLRDSWFSGDAGLWFVMTLVALVGTIWAWQRQLVRQANGDLAVEAPRTTELKILWLLSGVFVLASVLTPLLSWWFNRHYNPRTDLACVSMVVITLGVLAGTAYRVGREYAGSLAPLSTEGVMIAAILFGQVTYLGYRWGGEELANASDPVATGPGAVATAGGLNSPEFPKIRWKFTPPNFRGVILSTPLVHGNEIWVGAANTAFSQGTLFCLDRADGTKKWDFIGENSDLKQMISGPVIADGRLYIGEGFHNDPLCRLFCVDVKERKQLWAFQTGSQTEATPCVTGGKVYFGAGNDGLYCADAVQGPQNGEPLWRYPPKDVTGRLLRCGSSPVVVGNRLYAGSAVDRNQKEDKGETSIFCLDAETGKPHWKKPVPLPSWAGPVVSAGHAFFALGNGDVLDDAPEPERPGGLMLCVDMISGEEDWRFDVPNGILDKPAVDAQHVTFACRDGHIYCLGRHDGKLRWKTQCGSPVVASPVLARCPGYAQTAHIFAVSTAGKVFCLNPATGDAHWTLALTEKDAHFSATPSVVVTRTESGDRRQLYVAGSLGDIPGRPIVFCLEDFVKVE